MPTCNSTIDDEGTIFYSYNNYFDDNYKIIDSLNRHGYQIEARALESYINLKKAVDDYDFCASERLNIGHDGEDTALSWLED